MTQSTYPAMFDYSAYTGTSTSFTLNTCVTTTTNNTNNPPWANVVTAKSNFLDCTSPSTGTAPQQVALCYYSGPSGTVPCVLDASNEGATASCTCYVLPVGSAYSVDINAISSLAVYNTTVAASPNGCGLDGSGCVPTSGATLTAPVCTSINNNTLIPGAELISAFSDYLTLPPNNFPVETTSCPSLTGKYAGCMTAPCVLTNNYDTQAPPMGTGTGLQLATCTCPTYTGPYQLPNLTGASTCDAGPNMVWSASYTPLPTIAPPGFVGMPGTANCHGVTVAALANHFGGISNAAQAMGFGTVKNLQSAIKTFCGN